MRQPLSGEPRLTYVLPLRHDEAADVSELAGYVRRLSAWAEVLVVDGSPPEVFAVHHQAFGSAAAHLRPDARYAFRNGKVDGVMTGLEAATHERVVVADDDVRWEPDALRRAARLLDDHDVVRPQNFFRPLPWHARWDTARCLLNRAVAADYPGTLAVRRSVLLAAGGYDGDAMFENLELMRTVVAAGGTVASPLDLFVARRPPTARQFWSQRVRQAHDDFAQPARLVAELAIAPLAALTAWRRRPALLAAAALASMGLAEVGRRRASGIRVFPPSCSAFAPLWVAERAACVWLAVGARLLWGGCRYRGQVMTLAATPMAELRRRAEGRQTSRSA